MPDSQSQHFDLPDLIDYVRKTGSPAKLAAMQRHIELEGCERCTRSASMLAEAYGAARELAQVEVPAAVVRRGQAIFRRRPAALASSWWTGLTAEIAKAITGELPELAMAGLRSAAGQRHRIYSLGSLQVRLLRDRPVEGMEALVGALSDLRDPERMLDGCPVLLMAGDKVLQQTETSRFGEFHLEVAPRRGLRLVLLLEAESRRMDIVLDED